MWLQIAAMRSLRDDVGKRFRGGVVLYLGEHLVPSGDRLWLAYVLRSGRRVSRGISGRSL
jgi:hypothetical protein